MTNQREAKCAEVRKRAAHASSEAAITDWPITRLASPLATVEPMTNPIAAPHHRTHPDALLREIRDAILRGDLHTVARLFPSLDQQLRAGGDLPTDWARP